MSTYVSDSEKEVLTNQWLGEEKHDRFIKLQNRIKTRAINEFYASKMKKLLQLRWDNNIHDPPKIKDWADLKSQIDDLSMVRKNAKYENYFLTITTTPDKDKQQFITQIQKLFGCSVIDKGYLVFEQRGDSMDTVGNGLHAHILAFRDNKKYNHSKFTNRLLGMLVKLGINKTYKSVKGLLLKASKKSSTFSYQNIKNETVDKKIAYINGDKNEDKLEKVKFDEIFRKKFDLQKIYTKKI